MIPRRYIQEWKNIAPWPEDAQVEQDLVLSRALAAIFTNPFLKQRLGFRGGTALHKLYLSPQQSYSEDLDFVQLKPEPIKETIDHLRTELDFLGTPKVRQKSSNNILIYRFESETLPTRPLRLKIEINCREHRSITALESLEFFVDSSWFTGNASITTYSFEELAATKLRALYQRKKGRDLFDIYRILQSKKGDVLRIIDIWREYMTKCPSFREFELNMNEKAKDKDFRNDMTGLLIPGVEYDFDNAWHMVMDEIIRKI